MTRIKAARDEKRLRVCIASQSSLGVTDTFIRAHIDFLPFEIVHISGYALNFKWNGTTIRETYESRPRKWSDRALDILPRAMEFRIRKRFDPPADDASLVARFLREQHVDVVLAEYGTTAAFLTPACRIAGIPLVAHFHGFDASHTTTLENFAEPYADMFDYVTSVIAVSAAMRSALISLGCPEAKILVNHYGPHPSFLAVKPNYDSKQLIAVGRLTEQKAPYLTILAFNEALKDCPDLRLHIVGGGELAGVCADLVKALNLEGIVTFGGAQSRAGIQAAMEESFAFVQHSIAASDGNQEGTPVAILEAGAAGLAVISTFHAGIPDVVAQDITGVLVAERDIRGMTEAILRLSKDRDLARQMGSQAREHISTRFSMQRHLDHLAETLRNAAVSQPVSAQS